MVSLAVPGLVAAPLPTVTSLELSRFSAAYRHRLEQGFSHFVGWLKRTRPDWQAALQRPSGRRLDSLLAVYVQDCYDRSGPFWLAKHAVLAAQHAYRLKHKLPRTWSSLWAWRYQTPTQHRLPIPLEFVQAAFGIGLNMFLAGDAPGLMLPLCILLRLGFYGLLRPTEIVNLRVRDVLIRSTSSYTVAVLVITSPKNRRALGNQQFATIRDLSTVLWIQWLISGLQSHQPL